MKYSTHLLIVALIVVGSRSLSAQEAIPVAQIGGILPPGDNSPVLRLETGGPRSYVSGLAFSKDGRHLYSCGWDKAVQVWTMTASGSYEYNPTATLRIPAGGGLYGGLNCLAISDDGEWIATAGQGFMRGRSGERTAGWVLPTGVLSEDEQYDEGLVYVFNTVKRSATLLRGHRGPVHSVTFVRGSQSTPPELVSVAEERSNGFMEIRSLVRLWDVAKGTSIASLPAANGNGTVTMPKLNGFRPGLTAWRFGAKSNQVHVAFAWGDEQFRIWDVSSGTVKSAKVNQTISKPTVLLSVLQLSATGDRLFTGSQGEAGVWTIPGAAAAGSIDLNPSQFQLAQIDSVHTGSDRYSNLPSAATLIPAGPGGLAKIAMIVTQYFQPKGRSAYRLVIVDAAPPYKTEREINLEWDEKIRQPSLTVTKDGQRLAMSSNQFNEIHIYNVADVLNHRIEPKPRQILRGGGAILEDAKFVKTAGGDWGIEFIGSLQDSSGSPVSKVLDISERQIEPKTDKWKNAVGDLEKWNLVPKAPTVKSAELVLSHPEKSAVEIRLDDRYEMTAFAVCPKSEHCSVPLVAVAAQERGQPLLQLYRTDKSKGVPVRWCVGHTAPIRSLHFSSDGRMLLSVADDRTISIWTVTDLDKRTIEKRGRIAGLVVQSRQKSKLVVVDCPENLPLKTGDEILSVKIANDVQTAESAKDFYQLLLRQTPGQQIQLTIRRNTVEETVGCTIDQAIDEAKPLFTLFVAPNGPQREWDWIGWHPLGAFATQSDHLDRWLGWHSNTGEPGRPATFAPIGEYRERFYDRDLLQKLIQNQGLVPPAPPPPALPKISAWLRYRDRTVVRQNYEDRLQLNSKDVELVAEFRGVPERRILSLEALVDDEPPVVMELGENREWSASLAKHPWQRGEHTVTVRLKTSDREVNHELDQVDFRPPPPSIDWEQQWTNEIEDEAITVKAQVLPSTEPMRVQLRRNAPNGKEELIKEWNWPILNGVLQIHEAVPIKPGENGLVLWALNDNAPIAEKDLETAWVRIPVFRSVPLAPRVVVDSIVASDGSAPLRLTPGASNVYTTTSPQIEVRGKITAQRELKLASYEIDNQTHDLTDFKAGRDKNLAIHETFRLQPGEQSIVIRAAAGNDGDDIHGQKRITINYLPPLPRIKSFLLSSLVKNPLPERIPTNRQVLYEGFHDKSVKMSALVEGDFTRTYTYEVVRQNGTKDDIKDVDVVPGQFPNQWIVTATVRLGGGKNIVKLYVRDQLNRTADNQAESAQAEVEYLRPPVIVQLNAEEEVVDKPLDLYCFVQSPLPLRSATVQIDENNVILIEKKDLVQVEGKPNQWSFHVKKIGLSIGRHTLITTAENDEGTTLEPKVHQVQVKRQFEEPPVLNVVSGLASVSKQRYEFKFSVDSKSAPATAEIQVVGATDTSQIIKVDIPPRQGSVNRRAVVELFEGYNTIKVVAKNGGGFSASESLQVSFVPSAATIELTEIGGLSPKSRGVDGGIYFDRPISKSRVRLKGRVILRRPQDSVRNILARVLVNSFAIRPVEIHTDQSNPLYGNFEVDVVLGFPKNMIEIDVIRSDGEPVAVELGSLGSVEVDCAAPENKQDLYVLLIGNGEKRALIERARTSLLEKALLAKIVKSVENYEIWNSEAFEKIYVYEAVNEEHTRISRRLRMMTGQMERAQKSIGQVIAMVYYQGQITLARDTFAFGEMPADTVDEVQHFTGRQLEDKLIKRCGAHVVFFDLQQNSKNLTKADIWPKAPNLGIAVVNWTGDGEQPDDSRLVSVLEKGISKKKVGELRLSIKDATDRFPGQVEMIDRLDDVRDLRIGILE